MNKLLLLPASQIWVSHLAANNNKKRDYSVIKVLCWLVVTWGVIPTCRRSGLISMPPPTPKTPPKDPAKNAITGKISFTGPWLLFSPATSDWIWRQQIRVRWNWPILNRVKKSSAKKTKAIRLINYLLVVQYPWSENYSERNLCSWDDPVSNSTSLYRNDTLQWVSITTLSNQFSILYTQKNRSDCTRIEIEKRQYSSIAISTKKIEKKEGKPDHC